VHFSLFFLKLDNSTSSSESCYLTRTSEERFVDRLLMPDLLIVDFFNLKVYYNCGGFKSTGGSVSIPRTADWRRCPGAALFNYRWTSDSRRQSTSCAR